MKKFFCFHCQKEVKPIGFWKIRFCPICKRFMSDDGEGFYKVCDNCGANLSPAAQQCLKCGYVFEGGYESGEVSLVIKTYPRWLLWLINAGILFLSVIIGILVLCLSFYLLGFLLFVGLVVFIFVLLRSQFVQD